jgi:hypothetical protein
MTSLTIAGCREHAEIDTGLEDRRVTRFVSKNRNGAVLWELSLGTECGRVDGAIAGRQPHASAGTRRGAADTPVP